MLSCCPMRSRAGAVVILSLALAAGACGGDDTTGPDPTTTVPRTTSTSTTTPPTDEELITQLEEEWFVAARDIASGDRPPSEAEEFVTGSYLDGFSAHIIDNRDEGLVLRQQDASAIETFDLTLTGNDGTIQVCIEDADSVVNSRTGETVSAGLVVQRYRDEVAHTDEGWRIAKRTRLPVNEGVMSCSDA